MSYLTKAELKTHMNVDDIDVITDSDDTIVEAAIDGAISEAKGYLSLFDIPAIFAKTGDNRNSLLLTFVKDIAVWHLVVLSNYKVDVEFREKRYDRSIEWLKSVNKGSVVPDLDRTVDTEEGTGTTVRYGSNEKRNLHF